MESDYFLQLGKFYITILKKHVQWNLYKPYDLASARHSGGNVFQKEASEAGIFMVPYLFINFSLMYVKIYKCLPCMCYHQLNKSQF